jgi:hypothetical protein
MHIHFVHIVVGSVFKPVYTDTGIPGNTDTGIPGIGKNLPVLRT